MSVPRRVHAFLWVTALTGLGGTCASWGQPFGLAELRASTPPSDLRTVLGRASRYEHVFDTVIGCYDARTTGVLIDCRFAMRINDLVEPIDSVENHGGHTHGPSYPTGGPPRDLGELRFGGASGSQVNGQTANTVVRVKQRVPQVSGRIDTRLNVFSPPGWHTVSPPKACDATETFWCFILKLDVTVPELTSLPASKCSTAPPQAPICKSRNPDDNHTDEVVFYGDGNTLLFLGYVGESYRRLTITSQNPTGRRVSVNDMSLIAGGYFDHLRREWRAPEQPPPKPSASHFYHRIGTSADINKTDGDCTKNKTLRAVVDLLMPVESRSPIARRANAPGFERSRFLCELENNKNIHIDFDQIVPILPQGPF